MAPGWKWCPWCGEKLAWFRVDEAGELPPVDQIIVEWGCPHCGDGWENEKQAFNAFTGKPFPPGLETHNPTAELEDRFMEMFVKHLDGGRWSP
jgi:hypothetical protein